MKPNLKKFSDIMERQALAWVDNEARPYLLTLLNKAQKKLRRKISFHYNQMNSRFELDGKECYLSDGVYGFLGSDRTPWFKERYPELFEFIEFAQSVGNTLGVDVDSMMATVRPKNSKKQH